MSTLAYAYESGYQDGLKAADTEKAALERRIDELCAEVEAEKQRNAKLFEAAEKWMAKAAHFEAENAKLRELLLDVWNDATEFDGFLDYVYDDGEIYNVDELPHYQERMRELGIEVEK